MPDSPRPTSQLPPKPPRPHTTGHQPPCCGHSSTKAHAHHPARHSPPDAPSAAEATLTSHTTGHQSPYRDRSSTKYHARCPARHSLPTSQLPPKPPRLTPPVISCHAADTPRQSPMHAVQPGTPRPTRHQPQKPLSANPPGISRHIATYPRQSVPNAIQPDNRRNRSRLFITAPHRVSTRRTQHGMERRVRIKQKKEAAFGDLSALVLHTRIELVFAD